MSKLFVGNLSLEVTEIQVREVFEPHGEIREVTLVLDRRTRKPRGFAFVTFALDSHASEAMRSMHGAVCYGREIEVKLALDDDDGNKDEDNQRRRRGHRGRGGDEQEDGESGGLGTGRRMRGGR